MQERRVVTRGATDLGTSSPAIVAGGLIYLSGLAGVNDDGHLAGSDIGTQTRRVLDRMRQVLDAAGSSLAQAVNVNVYLKREADFDAMNAAYRDYFPDQPPARTTVVADLMDDALVEMSAVAVPVGAPRETLHPAGWIRSPRPYSYIVRTGDLVFCAGLVSRRDTDDQLVAGATAVQVRTILDNAGTLLKTAGLTLGDVVAARVFITDNSLFEAMNDEYRKFFPIEPPARATVVTGLMGPSASVEISLIASAGDKQVIGPLVSPTLPVSTAVRAGDQVYLSSVVGSTDANGGDASAQSREALARVGRTLTTAGLTFSDVVDSTLYLPDLWQYAKVNNVYHEFFLREPPARTVAGAKLVTHAGLVEMLMTAVAR
jgi:2-iminobutanoate/2-iminopropanoate deaminase